MKESTHMQQLLPREVLMQKRDGVTLSQDAHTDTPVSSQDVALEQLGREELLRRARTLLAQQQAQAAASAQSHAAQSQTAQHEGPQAIGATHSQISQPSAVQPVTSHPQVMQSSTAQPQVMQLPEVQSQPQVTQTIAAPARVEQSSTSQPQVSPSLLQGPYTIQVPGIQSQSGESYPTVFPDESLQVPQPQSLGSVPTSNADIRLHEFQNMLANKPTNRGKKLGRTIFNSLFYLLIAVMLCGGALFALSNDPGKSYFGYRLYTVKTASMTPAADGSSQKGGFRQGDTILVQMTKPEDVKVGDIVTFVPGDDPSVYLTHRVVEVMDHFNEYEGIAFTTKGDANDSNDAPITGDMLIGKKIYSLPSTGAALQFVQDNLLTSALTIASAIGAILLYRMYFAQFGKRNEQGQVQPAQYIYA